MQGAVLAVLDRPADAPGQLAAAAGLAPRFGTTAQALAVRVPAEASIMPTEEVLTSGHRAAWDAAEATRLAALSAAAQAAGVALRIAEGEPADQLAVAATTAGLLLLPRPTPHAAAAAHAVLRTALFASARPVLLLPPGGGAVVPRRIAIAWQDDGRAERAVLAALPLLREAAALRLLATAPAVPRVLADAALRAEVTLLPDHAGLGEALLQAAEGCDLLVMGAFGHSPLREFVFGGVTRHVLEHAALPVLMCH